MRNLLLIFILLLCSALVLAADNDSNSGDGAKSCERYMAAYDTNKTDPPSPNKSGQEFIIYKSWISGYLSAYNTYVFDRKDIGSRVTSEEVDRWIYDYCKNAPKSSIVEAAPGLTRYLENTHPRRNFTVLRIQALLNKHGYDVGPEDGLMGKRTRAAIIEFQRNNNMAEDGKATTDLLSALQEF